MPSPILPSTVVSATRDQVSCELQDEVVILNLGDGEYYSLNAVGARVWELIEQPRSVRELCEVVLSEYYDVDSERCEREVVALLEQLAEAGLLDPAAAAG